jgi:hypothetical protein
MHNLKLRNYFYNISFKILDHHCIFFDEPMEIKTLGKRELLFMKFRRGKAIYEEKQISDCLGWVI